MVTRDLDSQLEGLFLEIDPLPEAAEHDDGPLLEEIVTGLFGNETVTEINATGLATELSPVDDPFLNANPSERHSRVFDQSPWWAIQSQIAGRGSLRFALVLVMLVTVILVSIGIPMLMA
jgi:hypothetical protein